MLITGAEAALPGARRCVSVVALPREDIPVSCCSSRVSTSVRDFLAGHPLRSAPLSAPNGRISADVCLYNNYRLKKLNPRLLEKANQTDFPQPFTQLGNVDLLGSRFWRRSTTNNLV